MRAHDATLENFTLGSIRTILHKGNWAIITAENPHGQELPAELNGVLNADLECMMHSLNLQYIPIKGKYGGNEEHSFIVVGINRGIALELCEAYEQESVLIPNGLLYPSGKIVPALSITLWDTAIPEDYYSILPDGTCFTINLDF